jgi:type VI secretion system protein ImpM
MAAVTSPRDRRAAQPIGYYGKLPARADFVGQRLAPSTVACWDRWLQQCLARSQAALGASWPDRYLTAPIWRFALPAGSCGDRALAGVLTPSTDAVGRCFPLLLSVELPATVDTVAIATGAASWFEAVEALALDALDRRFELIALDRSLPSLECPLLAHGRRGTLMPDPIGMWIGLPMLSALGAALGETAGIGPSSALWWTVGGGGFLPGVAVTTGLMAPSGFAALLDGAWAKHGWRDASDPAPAGTGLCWDRDG